MQQLGRAAVGGDGWGWLRAKCDRETWGGARLRESVLTGEQR